MATEAEARTARKRVEGCMMVDVLIIETNICNEGIGAAGANLI